MKKALPFNLVSSLVIISLIAGLFSFSLSSVSLARGQEATESPLPTEETTAEQTPTETATLEPTSEPTATSEPAATATAELTAPTLELSGTSSQEFSLASLVIPEGLAQVPNSYIVVFKTGTRLSAAMNADRTSIDALGGKVTHIYTSALQGYAAILSPEALEAVRSNPAVDYVEADTAVSIIDEEIGTSATQSNATWGLDRIDQYLKPLNNTYKYSTQAPDVHVYVIDTGIQPAHTEFGGRADKAFDAFGPIVDDCNGHGTHVAGTIGGTKFGVAKQVSLHAVRVLDCGGNGTTSGVIAGVDWVTANHLSPAVANMSLGYSGGAIVPSLEAAVSNSIASGVVYVVSAGNDNLKACNTSPGRVPAVITVGATNKKDKRAGFSNFGSCLDFFAPGVKIKSAWIGSNTAKNVMSGTSMASPHGAGVAALYLQMNPNASPAQVAAAITNAATPRQVTNKGAGSPDRLLFSRFGPLAFGFSDFNLADRSVSTRERSWIN